MNTTKTKKKIPAKYKETVVTVSVTSLLLVFFLLLNFVILPYLNVRAATNITPHAFLSQYAFKHNSIYATYTQKDLTTMDILLGASVDTLDEITKISSKFNVSIMKFKQSNKLSLADNPMLTSLEYIKELNDRYFYILLKNSNSKGEDVYYCVFFEYLTGSDKLYTYSGVTVCIQSTLRSRSFIEERGFNKNVWTYYGDESLIRGWYERMFECEYPYNTFSELKVNASFLSMDYALYEYHLLSDGIVRVSTSKGEQIGERVIEKSVVSPDTLLFGSGAELTALFDSLREEITKGATS